MSRLDKVMLAVIGKSTRVWWPRKGSRRERVLRRLLSSVETVEVERIRCGGCGRPIFVKMPKRRLLRLVLGGSVEHNACLPFIAMQCFGPTTMDDVRRMKDARPSLWDIAPGFPWN